MDVNEFDFENRILNTSYTAEDADSEVTLRPKHLQDYIGQEKVKDILKVYIEAAKGRNDPLDHVLLYGPPGLGKTTLSNIIANEMGVNIRITSGPAIEKPGDLAALLTNLNPGDILFIDEIHRLNRVVEEILYPAMEDFAIDIIVGKGPSANSIRLDLPKFTLVGATTRAGQLSAPLRDRFGVVAEDHLTCFPVIGKLHIAVGAEDTGGVVKDGLCAVFDAEKKTVFHIAGENILPLNAIVYRGLDALNIGDAAKEPRKQFHCVDATGE